MTPAFKGDLPIGTVISDRYRVERPLGKGAMGEVYEVCAPSGERRALKVLMATPMRTKAPDARARFAREAAVAESLVHENICAVLEHGIDRELDLPFLVMPLLEGEDLAKVIEREGAVDPAVVVPLFVQASRGLAAAHAAGVVHRDVKPSNLFLARGEGGHITLKIVDFGLAKVDDAVPLGTLTGSNLFLGTPHYVSPEQATSAKRVDARSDLWSLAMSMYHALAGVPAFDHVGTLMALVVEVTGARGVWPLQGRAPWIDPGIARVVHGALVRDPDLRCPTANEFALALEMVVGFDAARAPVTRAQVAAVADDVRGTVARAARLPASWAELLRR